MEDKDLDRLIASAELRNPKQFNASRERYIAEISYKAGYAERDKEIIKDLRLIGTVHKYSPTAEQAYKAGMREVVECIEKNPLELYLKTISTNGHDYYIPLVLADTWQAKLKDWNISA